MFGDLAVLGGFGVKNHPQKNTSSQAQTMPARPTCSEGDEGTGSGFGTAIDRYRDRGRMRTGVWVGVWIGVGFGVGSPSWFTRLVLQPFLGLKDEKIF